MDIYLSKMRLKAARKAKFRTRELFAEAYDEAHPPDTEAGIFRRYANYENCDRPELPRLDDAANIADLLEISVDFLAGRIDGINHEMDSAMQITGFSQRALFRLQSGKYPQTAAFMSFLLAQDEDIIGEVERLLTEGTIQGIVDSPDARSKYDSLVFDAEKDPELKRLTDYLYTTFGASLISAREKQVQIVQSLSFVLQRLIRSFFKGSGEQVRQRIKRTAPGADITGSGKGRI